MWLFEGYYSGESKEYILARKRKQLKTLAIVIFPIISIIFLIMAIILTNYDINFIWICLGGWMLVFLLFYIFFLIEYHRKLKCKIEIRNDGFYIDTDNGQISLVFYKIQTISYFDDYIIINKDYVLAKALLIKGSWDKLIELLQKVEESLDSENPMYQIEEPETLFYEATVKEKRIFQKFVTGVSAVTPVGMFEYFILFDLGENGEMEYQVSQEYYEKITEMQVGTLVIVNGRFFSFGEGEDTE